MASRHLLGAILIVVVLMLCSLADQTDARESGCQKAEDCPCGPMAECKCKKGKCTFECDHGWGNCDGNNTNGCETDISMDPTHCGSCKNACPTPVNGTATCASGKCGLMCDLQFTKCGKRCVNPIDFQSDINNCGACGHKCPVPPHTTGADCYYGICDYKRCKHSYADCNWDPTIPATIADGCEVRLFTVTDCYACGRGCPVRNNTEAAKCICSPASLGCNDSLNCVYTECLPGFADLDGNTTNGCEAQVDT